LERLAGKKYSSLFGLFENAAEKKFYDIEMLQLNLQKLFSLFLSSAYVSGTYFRCSPLGLAPSLTSNNILIWKNLPGKNTLAYLAFSKMPQKKSFITLKCCNSIFKFFSLFLFSTYVSGTHFRCCPLGLAPGLTTNIKTRLEGLSRDKHSSLFGLFKNAAEKKVL
jgi:hypothetical protein